MNNGKDIEQARLYAGLGTSLESLPREGYWIVENECSIRCSVCSFNRWRIKQPINYCPNCGAKVQYKTFVESEVK